MIEISPQAHAVQCMQRVGRIKRRLKHYRCRRCNARRTLPRELWDYVRPPRCHSCNSHELRPDLQRFKEQKTGTGVFNTCRCDGVPYPHRKGSDVWCIHHPTGPTDQDYEDRYR